MEIHYFAGRGGTSGGKFRISLGLPVGAVINCADNTGKCIAVILFMLVHDTSHVTFLIQSRTRRLGQFLKCK